MIGAALRKAQQRIVRRLLKRTRVENHLRFEVQQRRQAGGLMRQHVVGAFVQDVEEQRGALSNVERVVERGPWSTRVPPWVARVLRVS